MNACRRNAGGSRLFTGEESAGRSREVTTPGERARRTFMLTVEQVGETNRRQRCEFTAPLFPLVLILDADGALAPELQPLVMKVAA